MLKLKLLTSRAGDGFTQPYGSTVEVDVHEARRLLDSHQAELLPGKDGEEAAAALEAAAAEDETESPPDETNQGDGETNTDAKATNKRDRKKK